MHFVFSLRIFDPDDLIQVDSDKLVRSCFELNENWGVHKKPPSKRTQPPTSYNMGGAKRISTRKRGHSIRRYYSHPLQNRWNSVLVEAVFAVDPILYGYDYGQLAIFFDQFNVVDFAFNFDHRIGANFLKFRLHFVIA